MAKLLRKKWLEKFEVIDNDLNLLEAEKQAENASLVNSVQQVSELLSFD